MPKKTRQLLLPTLLELCHSPSVQYRRCPNLECTDEKLISTNGCANQCYIIPAKPLEAAWGPDVVCRPRLRQLKRISELLALDEGKGLVV